MMFAFLSKLFSHREADGWQQVQREALLDLLTLAVHVDEYLSRSEKRELKSISAEFTWQGDITLSRYLEESLAKVHALEGDVAYEDRLHDIAERLNDSKARRKGLQLCERIIFADGSEHRIESGFIDDVKRVFELYNLDSSLRSPT
ncbi:MAG: hypothetical protein R2880_06010 [Deinococcales bacterium]